MTITDEKLSAFLDAELPEAEMEFIREQLVDDEHIANRLAELAMVDELVAASYATIDTRPLPDSITALLTEQPAVVADKFTVQKKPGTAKIIVFPVLQKFQNVLQKHVAIAASVVMVIGLGAVQFLHENNSAGTWQTVAKVLDRAPSGVAQLSASGVEIKPRLTFTNKQGEYCRQFDMTDKKVTTENIACRKDNNWQLAVSLTLDKAQQPDTYKTASGGSLLDTAVEDMSSGDYFDAQAESSAIEQHWSVKK